MDSSNLKKGIEQFNTHLGQLYTYGFTNQEIEKTKKNLYGSFKRKVQAEKSSSSSSLMNQMYQDFFYGNSIIDPSYELEILKKSIPKIDSTTILSYLQNINLGPKRYLMTTNASMKTQLPLNKELLAIINSAPHKIIPYKDSLFVPEKLLNEHPLAGKTTSINPISEIDATELILSNGVKIIYKHSDIEKNKVLLSGFRAGGFYGMDSIDYLTSMYAEPIVSLSGYGNFSREALSHFLAGNSAKVQMLVDKTRSGFFGSSNVQDTSTLFELFYLKWTQPQIDSILFDKVKEQSILKAEQSPNDKQVDFRNELNFLIKGKDYTTIPTTPEMIEEGLHVSDMIPLYNAFFGNAFDYTVIIISDQKLDDLLPYIETYLGGLPSDNSYNPKTYFPSSGFKKSQSFIRYASPSPKATVSVVFQHDKKIKDLHKKEVLNELVEGIIKIRLYEELRENAGKVYGVNVSLNSTSTPTSLSRHTISFNCAPEDASQLIQEVNKILKEITTGQLPIKQDLDNVKENSKKNYHAKRNTNAFWTKAIRDYYFKKYRSWDHVNNYDFMLDSITEKDIIKVIKKELLKTPRVNAILYPENYKNQ